MKKILSLVSLLAICLMMASCQSDADKACAKLDEYIKAGNVEELAKTADGLYSQKDQLSLDNLVDLTVAYNILALKESNGRNDATYLADYIEKALDCHYSAYSIDTDKALKAFTDKGQAKIGDNLNYMKKQLKEAKEAEPALIDQINS